MKEPVAAGRQEHVESAVLLAHVRRRVNEVVESELDRMVRKHASLRPEELRLIRDSIYRVAEGLLIAGVRQSRIDPCVLRRLLDLSSPLPTDMGDVLDE